MKTGSLFLLMFITLLPTCSKAQSYRPMIKEGVHWTSYHYEWDPQASWRPSIWLNQFYIMGDTIVGDTVAGDTIIHDVFYHKLWWHSKDSFDRKDYGTLFGLIREENKKVYFKSTTQRYRPRSCYNDVYWPEERLLYDFSLALGDSFSAPSVRSRNHFVNMTIVADSYTVLQNDTFRTLFLDPKEGSDEPTTWIEGMGSADGLFSFGCSNGWNRFQLMCYEDSVHSFHFYRDDSIPHRNPSGIEAIDCYRLDPVSIQEVKQSDGVLLNYGPEAFLIKGLSVGAEIAVYNMQGQLLLQQETQGSSMSIPYSGLKGLCLMSIVQEGEMSSHLVAVPR